MIDPRSFREAIRTATVTYPVPFVFSTLLLFSLLCFGGSLSVTGLLRWLLAGTAIFGAISAVSAFGYALLVKPELLRSESHALLTRYFDVLGDSEMDPTARERVSSAILVVAEDRMSKRLEQEKSENPSQAGTESIDG